MKGEAQLDGVAPTFLLLTGYEQVRSIAAHLSGNQAAADDVWLVLPETGVCNATLEGGAGWCVLQRSGPQCRRSLLRAASAESDDVQRLRQDGCAATRA